MKRSKNFKKHFGIWTLDLRVMGEGFDQCASNPQSVKLNLPCCWLVDDFPENEEHFFVDKMVEINAEKRLS